MNGICLKSCYDTSLVTPDPKIYDANYDVFTCVKNTYSNAAIISANLATCSNLVSNSSHDNLKVSISKLGYP